MVAVEHGAAVRGVSPLRLAAFPVGLEGFSLKGRLGDSSETQIPSGMTNRESYSSVEIEIQGLSAAPRDEAARLRLR